MGTYVENYGYDALGNILSMAHVVASGGWTRGYACNEASRIVASETGNRLSATSLPGDPVGGPFSATYSHDTHGNMTKMPHLQAMLWNEDDRLSASTRTAGGATPPATYYAYDSGGQRVRKVSENQTATRVSERIYLGGLEVYREFASDGTTIELSRESLAVMAGEPAARIENRTFGTDPGPAQQVRYQFANHLHSATLELGDDAAVISYEEYFPFGATSYQAVASQTDVAKRYRFTGCERDTENGLDCMGARYYAPWLGRWTACDPAGMVDGANLYAYVTGNPIRLSDPTGHEGADPKEGLGIRTLSSSEVKQSSERYQPFFDTPYRRYLFAHEQGYAGTWAQWLSGPADANKYQPFFDTPYRRFLFASEHGYSGTWSNGSAPESQSLLQVPQPPPRKPRIRKPKPRRSPTPSLTPNRPRFISAPT